MIIKKTNINDIEELKNKKVFIFDFDGTLGNTELYHWEAYNECLKEYNIVLKEKDIQKYVGNKEMTIYNMIKKDFDIEFDNENFFKLRITKYFDLVIKNNLQPYSFFKECIESFPNMMYTIVSSQKGFVIKKILDIWGHTNIFSNIISVADLKIEKNDVYSNTIKYYNFNQEDCVLFEDSNKYLKLGMSNGIFSVGIETNYNSSLLTNCNVILKV